jgi:DNA mismatch endonuclease (patch repair protein)
LADIVSAEKRSLMMSGISGKDTSPEKMIRSGLHRLGYRLRLHDRKLPGRPDIVFRSRRAVVEVRGCFWHGHDCNLFRWPKTRQEFWREKILGNIERDERNRAAIFQAGWRVADVWECQFKGKERQPQDAVLWMLREFLEGSEEQCVVGNSQTVPFPEGA